MERHEEIDKKHEYNNKEEEEPTSGSSSSSFVLEDTESNPSDTDNVAHRTEDSSQSTSTNNNNNNNDHGHKPWRYYTNPLNSIRAFIHRTQTLWSQLTLSEISGSLGDLGTLIPLVVAMARERSIYLSPALFFAGLANVITGYLWDVPMCVQPMKSIAAVAVSEKLSAEIVTAAGILTGILILLIGVTNLIELVNVIMPSNVVSGIQIGIGLRLAGTGIRTVQALGWVDGLDCILLALILSILCLYWLRDGSTVSQNPAAVSSSSPSSFSLPSPSQQLNESRTIRSRLSKLITGCYRSSTTSLRQHPVGVYLFLIGAVFAGIELGTTNNASHQYDLPLRFFGAPVAIWALDTVTGRDWKIGFLQGAVPQIPLTTLNSVISVCCLAHALYPEKRRHIPSSSSSPPSHQKHSTDAVLSRREVSISVGLMNVILCPFGAMPNCHGAGGLAAQHRLGARHGASVVFLGASKMILAIVFGAWALTILDAVPDAVLGVMLAIAGQELATTGYLLLVSSVDEQLEEEASASASGNEVVGGMICGNGRDGRFLKSERKKRKKLMLRKSAVIATVTAMVTVALGKTHYGALSGWVAHMVYGDGTADFVRWFRHKLEGRRQRRGVRRCEDDAKKSSPMVTVPLSGSEAHMSGLLPSGERRITARRIDGDDDHSDV